MQQRFLLQILLLAQHVSGITMPIIRSSRVLYSGFCLRYFVLWFSSCWSGVELRVMCVVCRTLQHSTKYHREQPLYNTLELLVMGIVVPETCWESNKICNKKILLHLVGILFPHDEENSRFSQFCEKRLKTACACDIKLRRILKNFDVAAGCDVGDNPLISCLVPPYLTRV